MIALKDSIKRFTPGWIWKQLRQSRLAYEYWSYPAYIAEHRYGRRTRKVEIHDAVAKDWYDRDWPDLPEFHLLEGRVLRPGARVFDIGAHQCIVAMMLADLVGDAGHVFAWEPIPSNVRAAWRNLELNNISNCTVIAGAVGRRSGTDTELGRVYTIDEMVQRLGKPDLIMVDVEGFEMEALRGAPQTLADNHNWLIEVHGGAGLEAAGSTVGQVLDVFRSTGRHQLYAGEMEQELHFLPPGSSPSGRFMLAALTTTPPPIADA